MGRSSFPTIHDVHVIEGRGPWSTKSGGELNVLFGIPYFDIMQKFLQYDEQELATITFDIRGLRSYEVSGIPQDTLGANEWHKLRQELVFAISGEVEWTSEDVNGKQAQLILKRGEGVWVPPYILHTYRATAHDTCLLVIANTLFMPDDPTTHDSYSAESFRVIQNQLAKQ